MALLLATMIRQKVDEWRQVLSQLYTEAQEGRPGRLAGNPDFLPTVQEASKQVARSHDFVWLASESEKAPLSQQLPPLTDSNALELLARHCEQAAELAKGLTRARASAHMPITVYTATTATTATVYTGMVVANLVSFVTTTLDVLRPTAIFRTEAVASHAAGLLNGLHAPAFLRSLLNMFPAVRACMHHLATNVTSPTQQASASQMTSACYAAYGLLIGCCSRISTTLLDSTSYAMQRPASSPSAPAPQTLTLPPSAAALLDHLRAA